MVGLSKFALAAVALASSSPHGLNPKFVAWASEHEKSYHNKDAWKAAEKTFLDNDKIIEQLNSANDDAAEYGHNSFSDLSGADFKEQYMMPSFAVEEGVKSLEGAVMHEEAAPAPASFDWRTKGAISPVKDQASCGSCWAFAAVQNIETMTFLADTSKPVQKFSVEQIIECDPYDDACYGGFPARAFKYVKEAGGITTETEYPYSIGQGSHTICLANQTFNASCGDGMCDDPPLTTWCDETCQDKKHPKSAQISGFTMLPTDEVQLAAWVAANGAPAVAIDASGDSAWNILFPWSQFYKKGIANPKSCSTTALDHAVHVVGYGTENSVDYWIVKNSWGAKWGEEGYFRLVRGVGKCGINTIPASAIAAKAEQTQVVV